MTILEDKTILGSSGKDENAAAAVNTSPAEAAIPVRLEASADGSFENGDPENGNPENGDQDGGIGDTRVLMGAMTTGLCAASVTNNNDIADSVAAYERIGPIHVLLESLDELLTETDINNLPNIRQLYHYFELLAGHSYEEVTDALDIVRDIRFIDPYANRLDEKGCVDPLHAMAIYAPHLHYSNDKRDVMEALVHYRIMRLIVEIKTILEEFATLGPDEEFPKDKLRAMSDYCKAIYLFKTDDIKRLFKVDTLADETRFRASLHDIFRPFVRLYQNANCILHPEDGMAKFGDQQLRHQSWVPAMAEAAHVYGEMFLPSAPISRKTLLLAGSIQKSLVRMMEDLAISDYQLEFLVDQRIRNGHSIIANRTRLFGIIQNLVRNAYDAKRVGETCKVKVVITLDEEHPDYVLIRTMDDGVGLSPDVGDKVFKERVSVQPEGAAEKKTLGEEGVGLLGSQMFLGEMGGFFGPVGARPADNAFRGAQFDVYLKIYSER